MSEKLDAYGFDHIFQKGEEGSPSLLLLHGTGGNEKDLIPLARTVAPGASLLSIRGKVREQGMPRFFRRFAEGVFDVEDIKVRTGEILEFLEAAESAYGIGRGRWMVLGYSNGANMGTSLLFNDPEHFSGGALLRPMPIYELKAPFPDLRDKKILLLGGRHDPIAPPPELKRLEQQYLSTNATVETIIHETASHGLAQADLDAMQRFLRKE